MLSTIALILIIPILLLMILLTILAPRAMRFILGFAAMFVLMLWIFS